MPRTLRSLLAVVTTFGILSGALAWQNTGSKAEPPLEKIVASPGGPSTYWKGNLHTHSLWSDGDDFPEMIADWYKKNGYHFLTLSDHNVLSEGEFWVHARPDHHNRPLALKKYLARFGDSWVERRKEKGGKFDEVRLKRLAEFRSHLEEPGKYLLIAGEEITHQFAKNPVHINAIHLRDVLKPIDGATVAETIVVNLRAVAEQRKKTGWSTIAFLNHPNFGWGVKAEDMLTEELKYFEIFNGHPDTRNYGDCTHLSCERLWDIVLAQRLGKHRLPIIYGMATDDAHRYHRFDASVPNPGRGWIMVKAAHLTAESLLRSIEAGEYYCSTGVVLKDVKRQATELALTIQAEAGVRYTTQFLATMKDTPLTAEVPDVGKVVAESTSLTPSYRLTGKELYVRAKVISTKQHPNPYQKGDVEVAWTQPVAP